MVMLTHEETMNIYGGQLLNSSFGFFPGIFMTQCSANAIYKE